MNAGAIILAGGKSKRMGTNKALLEINGRKVIEMVKDRLAEVFSEIILVTNNMEEYDFLGLPMVEDKIKGRGPLAGIHAGLSTSSFDINLIVACDMPFISPELAVYLIGQIEEYDVVTPKITGEIHPLFSVYNKSTLPIIEKHLLKDKLKIKELLKQLNVRVVTEEEIKYFLDDNLENLVFNMNSPMDYESVKSRIDNN
ncbi:molybdenum cofactor guanylyltransferase [Vulcanibacillus modesticaldus]|uniref:Probable molybdenum cofactor guanylyltransferase n=1 Tax=Vulcanibacillus modesticaldus TaxID=337097 RepID=A0A1D2YU47_9BACI|nr:molybdenum cofactor guanylyltransferase [Vulcanibacillus modesticaldus]OEF99183.1 molybdenum cofactor guanylyltransferase [Vulcanibacillus modesticaldus]